MDDFTNPNSNKKIESEQEKQQRLRALAAKLSQSPPRQDVQRQPQQTTDKPPTPQLNRPLVSSKVVTPQVQSWESKSQQQNLQNQNKPARARPQTFERRQKFKPVQADRQQVKLPQTIKRPVLAHQTPVISTKSQSRALYWAAGLAVLVLLAVIAYLLISQNKNIDNSTLPVDSTSPAKLSDLDQNKDLLSKVGQLIVLPTDEDPTIATVSDLSKLSGEPFFANAQIGDKVLIYEKAQKAILYRPETNQVIELAPLFDQPLESQPTPEAPPAG